jgi:uncharacterized protein YbjT (DUF2867 family)
MKIAVTTPTGNIGSKVTEILLDAGAKLVLLTRDPAKVQHFARRGADVKQGSSEDKSFVIEATQGVDALFWVLPPNMQTNDLKAYQKSVAQAGASAVHENKIQRVVNISSIGAQLGPGYGPISGLCECEKALNKACPNVTHLRAGFFFENFLYQLDNIRRDSKIYMPLPGLTRTPMIATKDIASVAANRLLDNRWTGQSVRGLHGPADLSLFEAVGQISEGLGQQVRYQQVPEEAARKVLVSMGVSQQFADAMLEMYRAMGNGKLTRAEPRSPETTTPTTLVDFARETILSQLLQPAHS